MSGFEQLPPPLAPEPALFISGANRSDDLFMFFRGQVGGLVPGVRYSATVSVEIATETPSGCFGIGGAPGESVFVKAGASDVEPLPVLEGTYLRMNIDTGNQSQGGEQARGARQCRQLPSVRAVTSMGAQVLCGSIGTRTCHGIWGWPRLVAVRHRLGIRGQDANLLHERLRHLHAGLNNHSDTGRKRVPNRFDPRPANWTHLLEVHP